MKVSSLESLYERELNRRIELEIELSSYKSDIEQINDYKRDIEAYKSKCVELQKKVSAATNVFFTLLFRTNHILIIYLIIYNL